MPFPKPLLTLLLLLHPSASALGQTENFNDGDDSGWTRQDSIGIIIESPFASFEFPDGRYRIHAAASPAPQLIGPSRAASLRQEVSYSGRLFLSIDLTVSDPFIQQSLGFLAFVQPNPAPGATSGYSLSYQPLTGDIVLNRIVNEVPTRLGYSDLSGLAGTSLRLVLIADAGNFSCALFNLSDLLNPIANLTAQDSTYTSGTAGLFAFSDTDDASGPIDAVFDNYRANPFTLPDLHLSLIGDSAFQLSWPDWAVHFSPSSSTTLAAESWEPISISELQNTNGFLLHNGDRSTFPKKFFRLQRRTF